MVYSKILTVLFVLLSVSCAKNPVALEPPIGELTQIPDFDDLVPDNGNNFSPPPQSTPTAPLSSRFEQELSKVGIQLSARELQFLSTFAKVEFKSWASTRSLSQQDNLESNFSRFQKFFRASTVDTPSSAQEYKNQALAFANGQSGDLYLDTKFYMNSRQLLVVKWDEQSGEFAVIRSDGSIANYLISRAVQAPRYIQLDF